MYGADRKKEVFFVDEINCVSEMLAPAMLQFLQNKTFGSHKVPEGWLIVAVGNPPEYNKSVREFDIVTLDRVRKIEVEVDCDVWMEYAWQQQIHGAILSCLNTKKDNFYQVENFEERFTVTGLSLDYLNQSINKYSWIDRKIAVLYEALLFERRRRNLRGPA